MDTTAREAARLLGSIKTPRKRESSLGNLAKAREKGRLGGRPARALAEFECTCGAGDGLSHTTTCPRGRAIRRRQKRGLPLLDMNRRGSEG